MLHRACLTLNANDISGAEHVDPQGIFTPLNPGKGELSCVLRACFSKSMLLLELKWGGMRLRSISKLLCNINTTPVQAW